MIWIAWWAMCFGIYPLVDPRHDDLTPLAGLDIIAHFVGLYFVIKIAWRRWKP